MKCFSKTRILEPGRWAIIVFLAVAVLFFLIAPSTVSAGSEKAGLTDTSWYSPDKYEFEIFTASQLSGLAELANQGDSFKGKTITLEADIDLSAYGKEYNDGEGWVPIGVTAPDAVFSGIFDGGGYTVTNLYIDSDRYIYAGLFGYVLQGTVKNLGVNHATINIHNASSSDSTYHVGGLAANVVKGEIADCYFEGDISVDSGGGNEYIGGVVGGSYYGVVRGCRSTGSVSGSSEYFTNGGGIAGSMLVGELAECYSMADVNANNSGGIVGMAGEAVVKDSFSTGKISGSGIFGYSGGVAGYVPEGDVENCYSEGYVRNINIAGGVVGLIQDGSIKNCYAVSDVSGTRGVGGVAGYLSAASVANCYSTGAIEGNENVGGVVGTCKDSYRVENCAALNSKVSVSESNAGRVAGWYIDGGFLYGNVAFDGMELTQDGKTTEEVADRPYSDDGEARTIEALQTASGFPALFTQAPWIYSPGALPGLFGKTVDMPEHLLPVAGLVEPDGEEPDSPVMGYQSEGLEKGGDSINSGSWVIPIIIAAGLIAILIVLRKRLGGFTKKLKHMVIERTEKRQDNTKQTEGAKRVDIYQGGMPATNTNEWAWKKTTDALTALTFIWFAIAGLLALMLWTYAVGFAIALCALPGFYLVTLRLKKQRAFATALYVLGILGVIVSAFYLVVIVSGGMRIIFLLASPIIGVVALMVFSLIFHIWLTKGAGALRRESVVPIHVAYGLPGRMENPDGIVDERAAYFPPVEKPVHIASFLLGLFAILMAVSGTFYGMAGVVCGTIGLILAIRAKPKYKTRTGLVLSIIGLALGAIFLAYFLVSVLIIRSAFGG